MHDHTLFLTTLSEFTSKLLTPYDVDMVVSDLMSRLVSLLDLAGSGVALADDEGHLQFTTGLPARVAELEHVQVEHQMGPCTDAFRRGEIVAVADLATQRDLWPDYGAAAERLGLAAVAGIPMRLNEVSIGAINLYAEHPRDWTEDDLAAAQVMADMTTSFLINASTLRQQETLNEQLRTTLESRSIIEQAKGSVAATRGVDVEEAFELIRSHARSHNVTVRSVAEAIVKLRLKL